MNINKLTNALNTGDRAKPQNAVTSKPEKGSDGAQVSRQEQPLDKVMLSADSSSMQSIEAEIKSLPVVDDATVDKIRSAIESGEYKIDYDKLAGNMLSFEDNLS